MTDSNFLEKNLLAHPDLPDSGVLTPARVAAAAAAWSISFPDGSSDEDQKQWINEIAVQLEPGLWGRIKTEASVTKHFITKWSTRGSSVTLPKEITVTMSPPLRPSAAAAGGSKPKRPKTSSATLKAAAQAWAFGTITPAQLILDVEQASLDSVTTAFKKRFPSYDENDLQPDVDATEFTEASLLEFRHDVARILCRRPDLVGALAASLISQVFTDDDKRCAVINRVYSRISAAVSTQPAEQAAINDIFDSIFTDFLMNGAVTSVDAQQQIDLGAALQWVDFDTIQSVGDKPLLPAAYSGSSVMTGLMHSPYNAAVTRNEARGLFQEAGVTPPAADDGNTPYSIAAGKLDDAIGVMGRRAVMQAAAKEVGQRATLMASVSVTIKENSRAAGASTQPQTASSPAGPTTLHAVAFTGSPPTKRQTVPPSGVVTIGINKRQAVFGGLEGIPDDEQPAILLRALQFNGSLSDVITTVNAIEHDDDKLTWLEQTLDAWDGTVAECLKEARDKELHTLCVKQYRDRIAVQLLSVILGLALANRQLPAGGSHGGGRGGGPAQGVSTSTDGAINAIIQSQKEVGEAARVPKHLQFTETDIRAIQHTITNNGQPLPPAFTVNPALALGVADVQQVVDAMESLPFLQGATLRQLTIRQQEEHRNLSAIGAYQEFRRCAAQAALRQLDIDSSTDKIQALQYLDFSKFELAWFLDRHESNRDLMAVGGDNMFIAIENALSAFDAVWVQPLAARDARSRASGTSGRTVMVTATSKWAGSHLERGRLMQELQRLRQFRRRGRILTDSGYTTMTEAIIVKMGFAAWKALIAAFDKKYRESRDNIGQSTYPALEELLTSTTDARGYAVTMNHIDTKIQQVEATVARNEAAGIAPKMGNLQNMTLPKNAGRYTAAEWAAYESTPPNGGRGGTERKQQQSQMMPWWACCQLFAESKGMTEPHTVCIDDLRKVTGCYRTTYVEGGTGTTTCQFKHLSGDPPSYEQQGVLHQEISALYGAGGPGNKEWTTMGGTPPARLARPGGKGKSKAKKGKKGSKGKGKGKSSSPPATAATPDADEEDE
jgi:hypothetical protein